jgi:inner membrane protein
VASEGKSRCIETFGVAFIDPVSAYVLSDRATKYGLLFIALTFVGVGLVEVLKRLRVHPVQYLLVGSALAVFFLLLVSLTEHLLFAWAYLAASAACTTLLAFYASFVLRGARAGAVFGAAIAALYGALYLLLQMEQSALVLGSLLLFAVLGAVMVATRRVDWYALMDQLRREASPPPVKPAQ